jgi:gas vesicle protein
MINSTFNQNEMTKTGTQMASRNPFTYFLIGGGIGAALGLLFAPKSGIQLRTDISDLTKKSYDETVDFAHQIKEQSTEVLHSLKEKSGRVYELASTKLSHTEPAQLAGEVINGVAKTAADISSQSNAHPSKTANIH